MQAFEKNNLRINLKMTKTVRTTGVRKNEIKNMTNKSIISQCTDNRGLEKQPKYYNIALLCLYLK